MNETTILLAPAPKAKADFLATVEPLSGEDGGGSVEGGLPFEVTLDSYTRDEWGVAAPSPDDPSGWRTLWLKSVDGRRKLPGFLKYLRERKKSAFGKFEAVSEDGAAQTRAVLVVPFDQPSPPGDVLEQDNVSVDDVICFRFALDERKVRGLFRPPPKMQQQQQHLQHGQQQGRSGHPPGRAQQRPPQRKTPPAAPKAKSGKSGLLGNLLGASRRTNDHLDVVPAQNKKESSSDAGGGGGDEFGPATGTSGAAIAKFRTDIEQKLLDFQKDTTETCIKVKVSLSHIVRDLPPEQKTNVTMDVLKFVLYEQTDEIGEEKWIAAKEPTDFLDEMTVAVYKEGHAPAEVLEEMNQGEMPDEIRQQQRAMAEARSREMARKEAKHDAELLRKTHGSGAGGNMSFKQLNVNKRDRRTIEEIQRDIGGDGKRNRVD